MGNKKGVPTFAPQDAWVCGLGGLIGVMSFLPALTCPRSSCFEVTLVDTGVPEAGFRDVPSFRNASRNRHLRFSGLRRCGLEISCMNSLSTTASASI